MLKNTLLRAGSLAVNFMLEPYTRFFAPLPEYDHLADLALHAYGRGVGVGADAIGRTVYVIGVCASPVLRNAIPAGVLLYAYRQECKAQAACGTASEETHLHTGASVAA